MVYLYHILKEVTIMELLSKEIFNTNIYKELSVILLSQCMNKKTTISYEEFKDKIIIFGKTIMKNYAKQNNLNKEANNLEFSIKRLPLRLRGSYISNENTVVINEDVIEKLYKGDILEMLTIFHELNHFKVAFDLKKEITSYKLIQMLKEKLLRYSINADEVRLSHNKGLQEDAYYKCNYALFREENYVEIHGITDLLILAEKIGIELSEKQKKTLDKLLSTAMDNYTNYDRDFTYVLTFNNFHMSFEEAFDIVFKRHPKWLEEFPVLKYEYYKDNEGKIVKRTTKELEELLNKQIQSKTKKFIKYLIMHRNASSSNLKKSENKGNKNYFIDNNNMENKARYHK